MADLVLTKHFKKRWIERVGNWPTAEAVRNYVSQSVQVQHCQNFLREDGQPYRILAIYWHPELDLVIKVDDFEKTAVTVLSRDTYKKRNVAPPPAASLSNGLSERMARFRAAFGFKRNW
jgi:hypothetical protein